MLIYKFILFVNTFSLCLGPCIHFAFYPKLALDESLPLLYFVISRNRKYNRFVWFYLFMPFDRNSLPSGNKVVIVVQKR